jgi:hypothetical protein
MTLERLQRSVPICLYIRFYLNPRRDALVEMPPNDALLWGKDEGRTV